VVAPPELHHCYSEQLALMPHCYFVSDYKQAHREVLDTANLPKRTEFGLPDDQIVYSCSNQLYKVGGGQRAAGRPLGTAACAGACMYHRCSHVEQ
jgi:predicted O-linked N-acetylglucosamine transferase (SPINDLY family)